MTLNETILAKVEELYPYMVEKRRYFHVNPEVSGEEIETSRLLKEEMERFGLPVIPVSGTGFIAVFDTGKPGKTLVLRADIDALPMDEGPDNLKGPKNCVSSRSGAFHGCGHDGHMAMQLAVIQVLMSLKDQLSGKILFAFEEGEEKGLGIHQMIAELRKHQPDAVYGTHLTSFMPTGTVCVDAGPRMAGSAVMDFVVTGKSGHASRPDQSVNPIFAVAQMVNAYPSAWVNQLDVTKTVTLAVTKVVGGTASNIIPESVEVGGTCRFFDLEEGTKALGVITKISDAIAGINNCTIKYGPRHKVNGGPVINDAKLSEIARAGVDSILPGALVSGHEWFASEPFRFYQDYFQSLFAFVGMGNAELGSGAEHHNIRFDLDEEALKVGVTAAAKFATEFLNA